MIKQFKEAPFWKITLQSAILFFVVVIIIEFVLSLFKNENLEEITNTVFSSKYMISKGVGAILYGLIIAFFYKRKAKKTKEN